jgi:hypothetical protein
VIRTALLICMVAACGSNPPPVPTPTAPPIPNGIDGDLHRVREATADAAPARERLVNTAVLDDRQKVEALDLFLRAKDREAIRGLCKRVNDTSIAWPCFEHADLDLDVTTPVIADLPVLGYDDLARIRKTPRGATLAGLRCTQANAGSIGIEAMFQHVFHGKGGVPPAVATIYHRASKDAPSDAARTCLLEESAAVCLRSILDGKTCPVLRSFADYVRRVSQKDRAAFIKKLIEIKNEEYQFLHSRRPGTEVILFYVHLVLAELLVPPTVMQNNTLWLPQYHVARAKQFFDAIKEQKLTFSQFLAPELKRLICQPPHQPPPPMPLAPPPRPLPAGCFQTCTNSSWSGCVDRCRDQLSPQELGSMCP